MREPRYDEAYFEFVAWLDEDAGENKQMAGIDHEITAAKLQELMAQLEPTDILRPNAVGNLMLIRNGEYIGFVDFYSDIIEFFEDDEKDSE